MTFAELIKAARKAAGLTQAQLAAQIGVAQTTISEYERFRKCSSLQILERMAKVLHLSVLELLQLLAED